VTKEASYYKLKKKDKVQCVLCPHECTISDNKRGKCKVRKNNKGKLISENYNIISALHSDPIEKKPLYHFFPGKNILSVGSLGCNLKCTFCQNSNISQTTVQNFKYAKIITTDVLINEAKRTRNNIGIAYTYNEPVVWYEYISEAAEKAKNADLKNVMVTNGFIKKKPLLNLLPFIDAFNVDLKAYSDLFYKKQTKSALKPVLKTIERIAQSNAHIEITNLIIPGLNDQEEKFKEMIVMLSDIDNKTILHLSRYFPAYKSDIDPTPKTKMLRLFEIAKEHLHYVYLGNMETEKGQNTYCPNCNTKIISRTRYYTQIKALKDTGCINCNHPLPIIY
jgi:pyruvate formate lyase activating enzyme